MKIENYQDKYHKDIMDCITEFYHESLHEADSGLDIDTMSKAIHNCKDNMFLLVKDDECVGLIAGLTVNSPLNQDKVFQELIWYVKIRHRLKGVFFLRSVEKILIERGYKSIVMAVMHNSKTKKLFSLFNRIGYKPIETHFRRVLPSSGIC